MKPRPVHMALLERMVDESGLDEILTALAQVCSDKAEHIRSNWQDEILARHWDKRMMFLDNFAAKIKRSK